MVDPLVDLLRERKKLCAGRGGGVRLEIRIGAVAGALCPWAGRLQRLEEDMEAVPTLQPGDRWRNGRLPLPRRRGEAIGRGR